MLWRLLFFLLPLALLPVRASEADAISISRNIQARHMPFGTILDPVFAARGSDQIVSYSRCGDSAIWTGHYLAAEAFRYKVTRSSEALENVKRALRGISSLMDVTGTNLLARCIVPTDSPYAKDLTSEEARHGIYVNNAQSQSYYWVGNTSRDQYSGVVFGLGAAYDLVEDSGVRSSIRDLATRVLDFLRGHNWTIEMPDGKISTVFIGRADQQLNFLQVGRHVNPDRFSTAYDINRILLSAGVIPPISLEVLSDDSYFKFNLDYINFYNLLRLESSSFGEIYRKAYDILRNHTDNHQNAFFNMIDRAVNGPNSSRDAETRALLDAWLQRPRRDDFLDLTAVFPSCGSQDQACNPIPVLQRVRTDFLWQRSPFQLVGGGEGKIEGAGIDYILPYWMARFYGLYENGASIAAVSAASGNPTLAPESIASLYGSNLAGTAQPASSQPLPTSLGGISLRVVDSVGVTRPAPLFYVSPGQVNFQVPSGTVPGQATLDLVSQAGATVATGTAQVLSVGPGLFTANATGKGVAAAAAVRVEVNALQSTVPVFRCGGTDCASVPIELGVDAPVYLSLFGTGIRNRSSLAGVNCIINGISVPVQYAGPQGGFAGLDQVNVSLPLSLRKTGETDLVLSVDGRTANTVRINIL